MSATAQKSLKALPNLFSLAGKSVVITGASGGMATTVGRYLLNAGASSIALIDKSSAGLAATAKFLREDQQQQHKLALASARTLGLGNAAPLPQASRITTWECDVSSQDHVRDTMHAIRTQNGAPLNVLVNTAGYCENISALDYPGTKLTQLLNVNLAGAMIVATEFARTVISDIDMETHARQMSNLDVPAATTPETELSAADSAARHHNQPLSTSASIVLIGSMSGSIVNFPQLQTPYNISKAGVIHLAKSLASEWASYGIRVNSLSPGYILTPLTRAIIEANGRLKAQWEAQIPVGRMAEPEEFAGPIIYMASDASSYMTGSDIIVDGGYCVR
ncbi:hypothetical protein D0Z00_000750 [Geotrichum galactomycetum]|uniref:Uncharacterized protein n=1 Tax=Geotrichum galactomycetum TaxID=27317 RepID=A0ACB6V8Z0_9ASCO|nr:hypothetical protein D0Z00_000750 [Geotrichum candidum]